MAWSVLLAGGCRTLPPIQSVDLDQPGWETRTGQALWQPDSRAQPLVTDLVFARHEDGRVFLQATKEALPIMVVRLHRKEWSWSNPLRRTRRSGRGLPPSTGWVQLVLALDHRTLHPGWEWHPMDGAAGVLSGGATGERLEVYLDP